MRFLRNDKFVVNDNFVVNDKLCGKTVILSTNYFLPSSIFQLPSSIFQPKLRLLLFVKVNQVVIHLFFFVPTFFNEFLRTFWVDEIQFDLDIGI